MGYEEASGWTSDDIGSEGSETVRVVRLSNGLTVKNLRMGSSRPKAVSIKDTQNTEYKTYKYKKRDEAMFEATALLMSILGEYDELAVNTLSLKFTRVNNSNWNASQD